MTSLFAALIAIAFVAIPIMIVVKIARRLQQMTRGISDPARLQRVFAEHAAAALRKAGADPRSVAKLEVLRQPPPAAKRVVEPVRVEPVRPLPRAARPTRPRPRTNPPQAPLGLDMGDRFQLSEPPEIGEPVGPLPFNANWLALAALIGAGAYYLVR